ncbi:phosphoenolpyruvate carboxykinase (ATP) [Verrucomicrobiaceae bacterium 227]
MPLIDLSASGLDSKNIVRNAPVSRLYMDAIRYEPSTSLSAQGALIAYSGEKTGRSPGDKRITENAASKDHVWWGDINIPIDAHTFEINRERAKDYLNTREQLYVVDAFAGWDPAERIKVRVICTRAYHALFMRIMLITPTKEELENFGEPDFTIYNAGQFPANRLTSGMTSKTSIDVCFETKEMVILGTEYAGEMKKGVFTLMHYLMPLKGHLSMHCSATADPETNRSAILFGLSGTGKTTLSADPSRMLIGDDEHVWTDTGVFNIEGGCYAKAIDLSEESEPDIYNALHHGAVLENVVHDDEYVVDFHDTSLTQNTRGAYPIEFIKNAQIPCIGGHPTDIIFLTCDAFGVLPPVSKLSDKQAMYHFISGYTAKVAGTEMGVTEPTATFSACFGAPFLVMHPSRYAELLAEKMKDHKVNVWLVNTGWTGGGYGVGSRIKLKYSRAIMDAIYSGSLADAPTQTDPIFGFETVTECPGVPADTMVPSQSWADASAYQTSARKLADLFLNNFKKYEEGTTADVISGGPKA